MGLILTTGNGGNSAPGGNPTLVLYSENSQAATSPVAQSINSVAIGYAAQTGATASYSLALGSQSLTRIPYSVVIAGGRFQTTGDAQAGTYLLRTHTTGTIPIELFVDGTGGSQRLQLPDNSTWTFSITVTAHRTDTTTDRAGYKIEGVAYRGSGASTVAFQGLPQKTVIAESNPDWDINITADTTHGSLSIFATGSLSATIRWLVKVETVEITN